MLEVSKKVLFLTYFKATNRSVSRWFSVSKVELSWNSLQREGGGRGVSTPLFSANPQLSPVFLNFSRARTELVLQTEA